MRLFNAWLVVAAIALRWILGAALQETGMDTASKQAMEQVLRGAVQLDLSLQDPDDELYVSILTDDGYKVCDGKLNNDWLDGISCFYDKSFLKVGDNVFHISVYSTKRKEVVLRTTRLFVYDGPQPPKWPVQQVVKPAALAAAVGGGGMLLRSILRRRQVLARPPSPLADSPTSYARPPSGLVSRKAKTYSSRPATQSASSLALKAVALCSGLLWVVSTSLRRSAPQPPPYSCSPLPATEAVRIEPSPFFETPVSLDETPTVEAVACSPRLRNHADGDAAFAQRQPFGSLVPDDAHPTPLGVKAVISATLLLSQALIVSAHHLLMVAFFGRSVPAPSWQERLVPLRR